MRANTIINPTTFRDELRGLVTRIGTNESARIADVSRRALQLWMRGPKEPCASMRDGVLTRLREAEVEAAKKSTGHPA